MAQPVSVSIEGIDDSANTFEYDEATFLRAEEQLRVALGNCWQAGARIENLEETIGQTLADEAGLS